MDYRQLLIDSGKRMYDSGLTLGTWGNISLRNFDTGLVYITPSGMNYHICNVEDINVYDLDGNLKEGFRKPSIEKNMHLHIYRARADVGAIMHTHPLYSSVFGVLGEDIPCVTEEFAQVIGKSARCARYFLPGTDELAGAAVEALGDSAAAILPNHGAVCVGADVDETFSVSEVLEKASHIYQMARSIGKPSIVGDDDIQAMYNFKRTQYGQRE